MESLPSVQDYCKNGLFPSQGGIGKKFCSTLLFQAAKFNLGHETHPQSAMKAPFVRFVCADFDHAALPWPKAATMMR
ncbi:hypothetical protein [Rhizobium leucaenae]|uniref:Uncharacterized protein n=1 Tax=Rhizobium leucaenae TaxID=29450 RepID=A0A7W7EM37_9HYPH|nr:hypothetical protein [Rhizobium leucaenae]MBB4570661.1 hypothetical protein [Rhizobium leucaenae]MBB6304018.1 hypothetical protein [Rhizobium leucaenae]